MIVLEGKRQMTGNIVQHFIRFFTNRWFHAASVWMFGLCSRLLIIYCDATLQELASYQNSRFPSEASLLQKINSIKRLANTASWMTGELGYMLFANVCSSVAFMLIYSLMAVMHTADHNETFWLTGFVWDLTDIFDAFLRLWVISHSADQLRSIVRII